MKSKWEEERANMNRHVFYEALKRTRDAGFQASSDEISAVLEQTDSLSDLVTKYHTPLDMKEPFSAKAGE